MTGGEESHRLLEALASFCSAHANNSLLSDCVKLLITARLVAVAKPNGGVRQIAVGETLRRLAAKWARSNFERCICVPVTDASWG